MTKMSSTYIYHFLILSWYIFLNYYISQSEGDPQKSKIFQNGGQWKYLTFLNLFLQAIFYGVACLDDVLKRITRKKVIKFITAFRDLLFTSLAFPLSTFVFSLFWAIYLYDRELIYPKALDDMFPEWLNHAMHSFIWPLSLAEFFLRPHRYSSKKTGLSVMAVSTLAYIGRVLWIYNNTGTWVYPVFANLSPAGRAAFFSLSYCLSIGIYVFGEKLNHLIWGDMVQPGRKKQK
ncbi:PREDICTED: androgen-dependent TFPI-regulating protein [Chrysochloris asiatica]|uniref:Androgen-dependent TFPI-regulating protein n=1 Tax=Chrysochloris asiatica TaxID=185453 RepID=A0A9B0WPI1_CHRAS|nr:PREDICTED: androgen-dependent TFPI-regulating protein [Chrysochloris asiatica]